MFSHKAKAIIVRFDNDQIGSLSRQSSTIPLHQYDLGTPIFPIEVRQHVGKSVTCTSPEVTRIQIPLVLSWSSTIHKVQGVRLRQVAISLKRVRTKGQAYVAVGSRHCQSIIH